jgi:site-specific recombinase XerD
MNQVEIKIRKAAEKIVNRTGIANSVANRVTDCLINTLKEKSSFRLLREDVKTIGEALVIGSHNSYQTWLHRDCFNNLIYELKKRKAIESPYFNIPQQISRYLIASIEREVWKNAVYVQAVRDDLLSLKTESFIDIKDEEEDCICSFIASAALFANILFSGFEKYLLSLKWKNVSTCPVYLEIPLDMWDSRDDAVFFRYHLPPPASIYFLRCILFYMKNWKEFGIKKAFTPDSFLSQPMQERANKFSSIFKRWLLKKQAKFGMNGIDGLTISSFRESAIMASLVDSLTAERKMNLFLPFLVSIQSRAIESDSFKRKYFLAIEDDVHETSPQNGIGKKDPNKGMLNVDDDGLKREIEGIIKRLRLLKRDSNLKERGICSNEIKSMSKNSGLQGAYYENANLYAEWVSQMLYPLRTRTRRPSIKTIVNYASAVRNLLFQLSDRAISSMGSDDLISVLKMTMDDYNSKSIRTALKCFTDFLTANLGDKFNPPNWRLKELRKHDIPTQKALVYFDHVSKAIEHCEDFFCSYIKKYRDEKKQRIRLDAACHKALIIRHMINLGFYAGVRASEFAHLKVANVIYDEGPVLCIRTTKTENGVRNIPINLLVPESYLDDFMEYYKNKKEEVVHGNELLFPDYKGDLWDTSHLASEVGRLFESIGIKNMRFHYLRHAFANWFLLRWFAAFHPEYMSDDLTFLKNELFSEPYVSKLKKIVLGANNKYGQDAFTYGLAILARLIGHGGPIVTMKNYIHCSDWLFYLLSKGSEAMEVQITSRQAQEFLQLSYPSLPKEFKGRGKKTLTLGEILYYQGLISP